MTYVFVIFTLKFYIARVRARACVCVFTLRLHPFKNNLNIFKMGRVFVYMLVFAYPQTKNISFASSMARFYPNLSVWEYQVVIRKVITDRQTRIY